MSEISRKKLIEKYLDRKADLSRFITARVGDDTVVEDLMQDLFLRVNKANLPPEIDNTFGYLCRMASNLALDHIRSSKRRIVRNTEWSSLRHTLAHDEIIDDTVSIEDAMTAKQRLNEIMDDLSSLSPKAREVFERQKLRGQSQKEIAKDMGISVSTVEKHMIKAMRHIMAKDTGES